MQNINKKKAYLVYEISDILKLDNIIWWIN